MLELSTEELTNLLNKASKGRLGNEKAQEIKESGSISFRAMNTIANIQRLQMPYDSTKQTENYAHSYTTVLNVSK